MNTFIKISFFVLLIVQISSAQWYQQTTGTTETLNSIFFIDSLSGWAVGEEGEIINTSDGGNIWNPQVSGSSNYLSSVFFISSSEGWFVGVNFSSNLGSIYHTTNGGNQWVLQTDTLPDQLNSVYFVSSLIGWTVGNSSQILKTTDGGDNWFYQSGEIADYRGVFFVNKNTGWAVGGSPFNTFSTIIKTTDGGDNWIPQTANTNNYLRAVHFVSETTGWVAGNNGVIFRTTDGGANWEKKVTGTMDGLYSIDFVNSDTGWIAGGTVLHTTDGGSSWIERNSGITEFLGSISFISPERGWVAGSNGAIFHTPNAGIPVELISFTSEATNKDITLNWITASEINNSGFEILRKVYPANSGTQNDNVWQKAGFVEGKGTTTEQQFYSFVDKNLLSGKYQYRLKQIDFDGSFEYSNIVEEEVNVPDKFTLNQNYPNPFNPVTKIKYRIPTVTLRQSQNDTRVTLKVYDLLGRDVATLVDEFKPAGSYEVEFNASALSSGTYFYRLTTGEYIETKKLMLLK